MADFEDGDIVRLAAVQVFDGSDDIVNVFHLRIVSGGPLPFATASLDFQEYIDDLYNPMVANLSDLLVADSIGVANRTQNTVWGNIAFDTYNGGGNTGDALPPTCALLAFGRTAVPRVQIRKYLGVFVEGDQSEGVWSGSALTVATNFINYHIVQQTMSNGLVLRGVAYRESTGAWNVANSGSVSPAVCTQRRRRRGRGS